MIYIEGTYLPTSPGGINDFCATRKILHNLCVISLNFINDKMFVFGNKYTCQTSPQLKYRICRS